LKVALISLIWNLNNIGVRYLSSTLKNAGHETFLIFHPRTFEDYESEDELSQLTDLLRELGVRLVGVNLLSNGVGRGRRLIGKIKQDLGLPVIVGGPHASLSPEECLQFADAVCLGEGEGPLREFCDAMDQGRDCWSVRGIWARRGGDILRNPPQELNPDIDKIPFPDLELSNDYVLHRGRLQPMNMDILSQYAPLFVKQHDVITSRGCPFECAYCCNAALKAVHAPGCAWVRRRSPRNVIEEIKMVRVKRPGAQEISISDECFSAAPVEWLREWADIYKREIHIPFYCSISPTTVTEEKMNILVDAGLYRIHMGIQSGSDRINREIYNRRVFRDDVIRAVRILTRYPIRRYYDIITDNPYESESERLELVDLLSRLDRPYEVYMYHLTFYPGSAIAKRAEADGIPRERIDEFATHNYLVCDHDYINSLIYLAPALPGRLVRFIIGRRFARQVYSLGYGIYRFVRYDLISLLPPCVKRPVHSMVQRVLTVFGICLTPQPAQYKCRRPGEENKD